MTSILQLLGICLAVIFTTVEGSGCYHRLTAKKGTLMSEVNFTPFLKPRTICVWEIEVAVGLRIQLDIRVFEIETSCCSCAEDFVEFRDGLNSTSPVIGRYCAKNQPERIFSSSNTLRVKFLSSVKQNKNMSSVNKFRAEYKSICGGLIRGRRGRISSPGFPGFSLGSCLFTVIVPYGWVKISFENFEVGHANTEGCKNDYVVIKEVYLVEFKNEPRHQFLCGQFKSKYFYSTGGQTLTVLYVSTSPGGNRFAARFDAVRNDTGQCGGLVKEDSGFIYSLGYPQQYPSNTECKWWIEVAHGFVELKFLVFNFSKSSATCGHGQVDIFDGWTTSSVKIRTSCGLLTRPLRIVSRTNRLLVRALSTNNSQTGIFQLRYRIVEQGLCDAGEFTCLSRDCVPRHMVCDGNSDCSDGSEELNNCPLQKRSKTLYALWVMVVFIAMVLMGFWLWKTWRKAVHHQITVPHEEHPARVNTQNCHYDVAYQSAPPPSYSEALLQTDGDLPTYEEAVGDSEGTQQVLLGRDDVQFINSANPLPASRQTETNVTSSFV